VPDAEGIRTARVELDVVCRAVGHQSRHGIGREELDVAPRSPARSIDCDQRRVRDAPFRAGQRVLDASIRCRRVPGSRALGRRRLTRPYRELPG
jgi:hypothetical protein